MPLRLTVKKELTARSDRVKSVDIFPGDNPWVLVALYSGNVYIWDYATNNMIKSFETGTNPVRCAKFIARKQYIVAGTDDMKMRVFNYNTMDKVKEWEAHTDYIRFIEIHPNRPFIFSCSDDMSIKIWDWEKDFDCVQVFEGHSHYVMMVRVNPRDTNTFASASLDKSIKVWGLTANVAHFSLDGPGSHDKGVNCIDYYPGGDKPYLLSGADDRTVKIWDYQTKACLQTLEGHMHNVSAVCFHPRLPVIISASEDGTVRLWHSTTYRPETTLNYGLERAWAIACTSTSNKVAIGYDEGTIVLKLGNERPVASLDTNSGKLVWAKSHDIQTISLKGISKSADVELVDGERVPLQTRDLGACEVYPQQLHHNSNGSFICVCGDGEYIIYTSQALRNKAFGSALDFVWSELGSGDYAIRESISRVRTFKNFKDHKQITLPISSADGIFGGFCLAVKGPDCVVFFSWEDGSFIRKIDVIPINIYWNEAGDALVISCSDCFYILRYNADVVATAMQSGTANSEDGVEGSFELVTTINERLHTGQWVGECFLFTNSSGKLNYIVGGELMTLCHLPTPQYLLGYVPKEDRVFLIDKQYNVFSYRLLLSVLSYQTAVVREDFDAANALLPQIPKTEYSAVARFLESQGYKEEALAVTSDPDHKFELAIDLKKMDIARKVLQSSDATFSKNQAPDESTEVQSKWRRLGDLALINGDLQLAEICAKRSADLSGLLLLCSSTGDKAGMRNLAEQARSTGRLNVAFLAYFLTGQVENAIELLVEANRLPEAAFFARTYMPSQISRVLEMWKSDLKQTNEKAAEALADPAKYPNLFADLDWALKAEQVFLQNRNRTVPASMYSLAKGDLDLDLISLMKAQGEQLLQQQQQEIAVEEQDPISDAEDQQHTEEDEESEQEDEEEEQSKSVPSSPAKSSMPINEEPVDVIPVVVQLQTLAVEDKHEDIASAPSSPARNQSPVKTQTPVQSPVRETSTTQQVDEQEESDQHEEDDDDDEDLKALIAEENALMEAARQRVASSNQPVSSSNIAVDDDVQLDEEEDDADDAEDVEDQSGDKEKDEEDADFADEDW